MNNLSNYLKNIFVFYFKHISYIFGVRVRKKISPDFILEYKSTPYKDYKCWIIDKKSNKKSKSFSAPRKYIMSIDQLYAKNGINHLAVFRINTDVCAIMNFPNIYTCNSFEKVIDHIGDVLMVQNTIPNSVRFLRTCKSERQGAMESRDVLNFDYVKKISKSVLLVGTKQHNLYFLSLETMQLSPAFQAFEILDSENTLVCVEGTYFIISFIIGLSIMGFKTHLPTVKNPVKIADGYYLLTDQDGSLGIYDLGKNNYHQSLGSEIEKTSQNGLFLITDNSEGGSVKEKYYFSPKDDWTSSLFSSKKDVSTELSLVVNKAGFIWLIDRINYHETDDCDEIIELGNNCFHIIHKRGSSEQFAMLNSDNDFVCSEIFSCCKQVEKGVFVYSDKDLHNVVFCIHKGFSDYFVADNYTFDSEKREIVFEKNNPKRTITFLVEDFTYITQVEF